MVNDERQQILEMLQAGHITANEAADLLSALGESREDVDPGVHAGVVPATNPPDFGRFRHFWRWPFAISASLALLFALLLVSMTRSADGRLTLALICTWPLFIVTGTIAFLALWSRWATWVHVRIQEKGGRRIPISLPVPLGIGQWAIGLARWFVDDATKPHLEMAEHFLHEMRQTPDQQPLMIDVNDDDGDRVQVYIG